MTCGHSCPVQAYSDNFMPGKRAEREEVTLTWMKLASVSHNKKPAEKFLGVLSDLLPVTRDWNYLCMV